VIVADNNLLVYLYVSGTRTSQAEAVFQRDPLWVSPYLWRSEFRNTLTGLVRWKTITLETAHHIANRAEAWMTGREYTVSTDQVLDLAGRSNCSAYDCEYVALAKELGVSLITADRAVLKAFPTVAISIDKFVA